MIPSSQQLRITELFLSLQGESTSVGLPTVFVRLTGCPLRCQYCDSAYAFSGGEKQSLTEIIEQVKSYGVPYVCVTGGEPLAQKNCLLLLELLCEAGFNVSLETSGALDISTVDKRVTIVMDIKTPESQEEDKNLLTNFAYLKKTDQIKFVLCSRKDYEWAMRMVLHHKLHAFSQVLFSPSWQQLGAETLADWIIKDRLPVRFQLQLHKILWGDTPGR